MKKLSKADKMVQRASALKKKWIPFCPACKSTDVALAAYYLSTHYKCRKCGYSAPTFPEKKK